MASLGTTAGPDRVGLPQGHWLRFYPAGVTGSQSHTHSILEIAECGVAQAASRWRPTPGHSWRSPSCMDSSTGMCPDRRTAYRIFC